MNDALWLKFIKPAPSNESESNEIRECIQGIIKQTVEDANMKWDFSKEAQKLRDEAKMLINASVALDALPEPYRIGLIKEMASDFRNSAKEREDLADEYAKLFKSGRGRPLDRPKRFCFVECYSFLNKFDKRASWGRGGTVPGLASFVWHEATGEEHSIDLWVEVGKRALPWVVEQMVQQKTEPKRILLP